MTNFFSIHANELTFYLRSYSKSHKHANNICRVYHFSPPCNTTRQLLNVRSTPQGESCYTSKIAEVRRPILLTFYDHI